MLLATMDLFTRNEIKEQIRTLALCAQFLAIEDELRLNLLRLVADRLLSQSKETILGQMLGDYFMENMPTDQGEVDGRFEEMMTLYTGQLSTSLFDRVNAYLTGNQLGYLAQSSVVVTCDSCRVSYFHIGLIEAPVCGHCGCDKTSIDEIDTTEIPPWIDLDQFFWYGSCMDL